MLTQVDAGTVTSSALSLLDKTVIGSLLILSWALTIALAAQLIRVQNARVVDQKSLSDKSERLTSKMLSAFTEMKGALDSLKDAEKSGQQVTEALKNSISSMQQTLNLFLISQGRRLTPLPKPPIDDGSPQHRR